MSTFDEHNWAVSVSAITASQPGTQTPLRANPAIMIERQAGRRGPMSLPAVLENRRGDVVGIAVKAASTVGAGDFRGLRHLAQRTGNDFRAGIVLHTGPQTLRFGPKMLAIPVSALWLTPTA